MASSWLTPGTAKNKPHGKVIGEIFFATKSAALTSTDKKLLDKLVEIFESHPKNISPKSRLLLLGDTDVTDSGKTRDHVLAKKRADAVRDYVVGKLKDKKVVVQIESVGKRDSPMPGRRNKSSRRRVVEIINKGHKLKKGPKPAKPTKSWNEALASAKRAYNKIPGSKNKERQRIRHWLIGAGSASVRIDEKRRDGYFHRGNKQVRKQAQNGPKLSPAEFKELLDHNRIAKELMEVGHKDTPVEYVASRLLAIDEGILGGIDYLTGHGGNKAATGKSPGLVQMIRYILSKPDDWTPPSYPFATVKHGDRKSFYWIYFQDLK